MRGSEMGACYGGFSTVEFIGSGGNGRVLRARGDWAGENACVALKLLDLRRASEVDWRRFAREVAAMRSLADDVGVLPVIDADAPAERTAGVQPWYAMPLATPIRVRLANANVEEIVTAVASLAESLSRIHGRGYFHRDIKPRNLFSFEGAWVLGDFGLVQTPDPGGLTEPGRKLGPANFLPYEALVGADTAKGGPIDVYELAKTLWALVCDVEWPPFGHQAVDAGYPIEGYRAHPHARELDRIIDRCTRLDPSIRPVMGQLAADLHAWLEFVRRQPEGEGLAAAAAGVRRRLGRAISAAQRREREENQARDLIQQVRDVFAALALELKEEMPGIVEETLASEVEVYPRLRLPAAAQARAGHVFAGHGTILVRETGGAPVCLAIGHWVEFFPDGTLLIRVGLVLDIAGSDEDEFEVIVDHWVPVESTQAQVAIQGMRSSILVHLPERLERFGRSSASE